jgi:RHS repeat-associated protein
MEIIKYFPFGASRNSTGTLPTDKLFTGQRRDIATAGSELYYYGARYYDPNIGRFTSPDTVVPNPTDPQSLNRYSYCYNNPLKYSDPSGHIVTINGIDVSQWGMAKLFFSASCNDQGLNAINEGSNLYSAYSMLNGVSPEITNALEKDKQITNVTWGATGSTLGLTTISSADSTRTSVSLNQRALTQEGAAGIATVLAHEFIHASAIAADPTVYYDYSCYEESIAFQFQAKVGGGLNYTPQPHNLWQNIFSSPMMKGWNQYVTKC